MMLSLRNAAEQAGVSKSTILRAIKNGRLSASRTDAGGYDIDPSEVSRVYPAQRCVQHFPTQRNAALDAEIDGLKQLLAQVREQLDKTEKDREGWRHQAEATQRLLESTPRRWWQRKAG